MSTRTKLGVFAGIVLLAIVGGVGSVLYARHQQAAAAAQAPAVATRNDLTSVAAGPHIVFRNTALNNLGLVALAPLDAPDGPRAFTSASCDRVYATAASALCLEAVRGLVTTYKAKVLGPDFAEVRTLPLTGLPSRARMSRDGTLTATTTFVFGDSYANPGQFSTRSLISRSDGSVAADLETFDLRVDGRSVTAADRNLWGVTFVDDDRFYATAASGGRTWLVEGSISARRLTSLRGDVECPSLSPDGTRIAFKKHGDLPAGKWRLAVYDIASHRETVLAETRSVDDQVEWLDNSHVLYGLPRESSSVATSDIWRVPADGGGTPSVLIHDAWSPAVVR